MKINTISISDPCFSKTLATIPRPPKSIYVLGNAVVDGPAVAIVGTRKPTPYGTAVTLELAEKLAKRGVVIVSGLALGVDGIAHQGALNVGGRAIAVLASGLDQISPRSHRELAIRILEKNGAIVSENPPGTPPLKWEFLKRNRLVSGLADAVIVTEASAKSGTMNTVMHALEQGRDVYAVPGNITSPSCAGCNKLIEQGATPIVNIDDFIERFAPSETVPKQQLLLAETPEEQTILDLIQSGISDGDEIQKKSKLDASTYSTTMTMLELRGVIRPLGANHWTL
jgi:DNA processing protein